MDRFAPHEDVREFHEALSIPSPATPELRRPELRARLIEEEALECSSAIIQGDFIGAIDGLCDLLCVTYGAALEWGIDLAPFWAEVHRTNMAKAGGPVREDGKVLKPEGWTPPRLGGILARVMEDRADALDAYGNSLPEHVTTEAHAEASLLRMRARELRADASTGDEHA